MFQSVHEKRIDSRGLRLGFFIEFAEYFIFIFYF